MRWRTQPMALRRRADRRPDPTSNALVARRSLALKRQPETTVHQFAQVLRRVLAAAAVLVVGAVGCGSSKAMVAVDSTMKSATPFPVTTRPLVNSSTTSRVQAAVGDADHALFMTNGIAPSGLSDIDGGTVMDGVQHRSAIAALSAMSTARLLPWSKGCAIGGTHCDALVTAGEEKECADWTPTVVFLNPVVTAVTGPAQKQRADFLRAVPGGDRRARHHPSQPPDRWATSDRGSD